MFNNKLLEDSFFKYSDAIIIKDYQPEVKRYGGKQNLPTIENIFCESVFGK